MPNWIGSVAEPMDRCGLGLNLLDVDAGILLPVIIICGISVLLISLWVLGVWGYLWLACRYPQK